MADIPSGNLKKDTSFKETVTRITNITRNMSTSQKLQFETQLNIAGQTTDKITGRCWLVNTTAISNLSQNLITKTLIEKVETLEEKIAQQGEAGSYTPLINSVIDGYLSFIPDIQLLLTAKNILQSALSSFDSRIERPRNKSTSQNILSLIINMQTDINRIQASYTEDGMKNLILDQIDSILLLKQNPLSFLMELNSSLTDIDRSTSDEFNRLVNLATARFLKIILNDLDNKKICWVVYAWYSNDDASNFLQAAKQNFKNGIEGQYFSFSLEAVGEKRNGVDGVPEELIENMITEINKILKVKEYGLSIFDFTTKVYVRTNMYLNDILTYPRYKPYWATLAIAERDASGKVIFSPEFPGYGWVFRFRYNDFYKSGHFKEFLKDNLNELDGGGFRDMLIKEAGESVFENTHSYFLKTVESSENYLLKLRKIF
jgi:hypothetical protein